ncbi:MAG: hypothetical protein SFV81_01575 [Pirellulaceae bacterium]|nr:hypothetical protein [Pirellulaceae bacterium]
MTPAMLEKVVYAGSRSTSFVHAAEDICKLAEADISSPRIRRATEQIGNERAAQSVRAQKAYDAMHLPDRQLAPEGTEVPEVACIQMDGGRIQIRKRSAKDDQAAQTATSRQASGFWRESKVGCLLSMTSQTYSVDPVPVLPPTFTDIAKMHKMCSEIKGFSSPDGKPKEPDRLEQDQPETQQDHGPEVVVRSVIASMACSSNFGLQLASAAYERGLNAAVRKAFVCDGQLANWNVWEQWFSHYTPIVDFIHAICYVFAAAMAGKSKEDGWSDYLQWSQWLWQGDVNLIIQSLKREQATIGLPTENECTTTRRYNVARTLTYLTNQRGRMSYPEYRREGLPITSSYIESTIKQINKRVKGTEKFWDRAAEAILHLAADHTGSTKNLEQFWAERPATLASTRSRCLAA